MPKWIKGKNGKFAGSIGDGKANAPTAAGRIAALLGLGQDEQPQQPSVAAIYEAWKGSEAELQSNYNDALREVEGNPGQGFSTDFQLDQSLRHHAEKFSATDYGQVKVLEDAVKAAKEGRLRRANLLLEAAAVGRDARDREARKDPNLWRMNALLADREKDDFDRVEDLEAAFRVAATTPWTAAPSGGTPGKTYPFKNHEASEALRHAAQIIYSTSYEKDQGYSFSATKKDVYPAKLVEEAKAYMDISYLGAEPGNPDRPSNEYAGFLWRATEAHKENKTLVTRRAERLLRTAQTVQYHNSPEYQEKARNPFDLDFA